MLNVSNAEFTSTGISGAYIRANRIYGDNRGRFSEIYQIGKIEGLDFKQDSYSYSHKGVARGLHAQVSQVQVSTILKGHGKYLLLDVHSKSATFGKFLAIDIHAEATNQILALPGIAHGFIVESEDFIVSYKSSVCYEDTMQFVFSMAGHLDTKYFTLSDRDRSSSSFEECKVIMQTTDFDPLLIRENLTLE